jgi:hypothetical protein
MVQIMAGKRRLSMAAKCAKRSPFVGATSWRRAAAPVREMVKAAGRVGALGLALTAVAACTMEQAVRNPATQRFVWYRYLNGEDLRADCAAGSLPRYRFVYNARYQEQLRRYEVVDDGGGGAYLIAQAQGSGNFLDVRLDDVLAPWRWKRVQVQLPPDDYRSFQEVLERSGFDSPAPQGLHLPSAGFYWVGVACRDGAVRFNAWRHPSPRYDRFALAAYLFARDLTEVPVNMPRPVDDAELLFVRKPSRTSSTRTPVFSLTVGANGLEGF